MYFTFDEGFLEIQVSTIDESKNLEVTITEFEQNESIQTTVTRKGIIELKAMLSVLVENFDDK